MSLRLSHAFAATLLASCTITSGSSQAKDSCTELLQQIESLPIKWDCDPKSAGRTDSAHCALLDSSTHTQCLASEITDETMRSDPRSLPRRNQIAVGDLAFFVLNDIYPNLWDATLPPGTDGTDTGYFKVIASAQDRRRLQERVRSAVKARTAP